MTAMTAEQMKARIAQLEAQLKAPAKPKTSLKVSTKGAVSFYGLGRFPVTLYRSQWETLLAEAETIKSFIEEHKSDLASKE